MDILLTFAGNRDPFNPEIMKGSSPTGRSLRCSRSALLLPSISFTTPNTLVNAQELQREIGRRGGDVSRTRIHNLDIPDPRKDGDREAAAPSHSASDPTPSANGPRRRSDCREGDTC